jgi:hypothetical protein
MSSGSGQLPGKLVCGRGRHAFLQLKSSVAVGAFNEPLVSHIKKDTRVSSRPTIAIAGDPYCLYFDDLGWFYGHLILFSWEIDRADRRMIPKEHKQSMWFRLK